MRRDVLEQDEIEGSVKLVRKLKFAGCFTAVWQYCEAGDSWQTLQLCCDVTQASICVPWLKSLRVTSFVGRM